MEIIMELKKRKGQEKYRMSTLAPGWILALLFMVWIFPACEVEFIPKNINLSPELVVEGYVEAGPEALPAYVILTRSKPFFSELSLQELDDLFVRNATVTVNDGQQTTTLSELCFNDLPSDLRQVAAERLGLNPDSVLINFCVYVDLGSQINPEPGKSYHLKIIAGDERIEATTTVPEFIPLDSLWWREAPGKPIERRGEADIKRGAAAHSAPRGQAPARLLRPCDDCGLLESPGPGYRGRTGFCCGC